jgi:hypothetical protein
MPTQTGFLDANGHPRLKIIVTGTNAPASVEVEALIDTGFTGFLMLPLAQALPLGLVLYGTGDYTLADGSRVTNFLAKGSVKIPIPAAVAVRPPPPFELATQPESAEGIIVLAGTGALLGMEFLRALNKLLLVGSVVVLVDQAAIPGMPPAAQAAQA